MESKMVKLNEWMQILDGTTEFRDLTLPGSNNNQIHTHDIRDRPKNEQSQTTDVATQFDNGSRWFDAELELHNFLVPYEVDSATSFTVPMEIQNFQIPFEASSSTSFAVPMEIEQLTGNVSGSTNVNEQLNQLKLKIMHNKTEFIVLRIFNLESSQHNQIAKILREKFGNLLYLNSVPGSDVIEHSLARAQFKDLRGRIVILFDSYSQTDDMKTTYSHEGNPIHPHVSFNRYDGGGNTSAGCLNTYGTRLGIPDKSIRKVIEATLIKKTGSHSSNSFCNQNPGHLFIVYMTGSSSDLNSSPVRSHASGGMAKLINQGTLMGPGDELRRKLIPNVIMCDEIDSQTSAEIIKLNYIDGIARILFSEAVNYGPGITMEPEQLYQNAPDFQQPNYANLSKHATYQAFGSAPNRPPRSSDGYEVPTPLEGQTDSAGYEVPGGEPDSTYATFGDPIRSTNDAIVAVLVDPSGSAPGIPVRLSGGR